MLTDIHCHVVPPEIAGDPAAFGARDPHFARLVTTKGARFTTGDDLLRDMASGGVDRAVAFGFAFKDTALSRMQNDYSMALAKAHPGSVAALGVLDPESPGAMEEAERCLEGGVAGFGEIFPAGHGFSLDGEAMARLAGLAAEAGVPILIHVNEQVGHQYPGKDDVGALEAYRLAVKCPSTTFIFAHLGGGLPLFAAMPEVARLENAYYDTAAQPYLYAPRVYAAFRDLGVLPKIALGSDYPLLSCARYVRDISLSGLSLDEQDAVLWKTASALFASFFS